MTIKEACIKAGVDLEELYKETEEYFKLKMQQKSFQVKSRNARNSK